MHQNYNQLFPASASDLAEQARDKRLLAYHDIRTGNLPNSRLTTFLHKNLPSVLVRARPKFEEYRDLLKAFGDGDMHFDEFAARVRRRSEGTNEDSDWADSNDDVP